MPDIECRAHVHRARASRLRRQALRHELCRGANPHASRVQSVRHEAYVVAGGHRLPRWDRSPRPDDHRLAASVVEHLDSHAERARSQAQRRRRRRKRGRREVLLHREAGGRCAKRRELCRIVEDRGLVLADGHERVAEGERTRAGRKLQDQRRGGRELPTGGAQGCRETGERDERADGHGGAAPAHAPSGGTGPPKYTPPSGQSDRGQPHGL